MILDNDKKILQKTKNPLITDNLLESLGWSVYHVNPICIYYGNESLFTLMSPRFDVRPKEKGPYVNISKSIDETFMLNWSYDNYYWTYSKKIITLERLNYWIKYIKNNDIGQRHNDTREA